MKKQEGILIVNDSEMTRAILQEVFSDEYRIYEAENGKDAIALLKAEMGSIDLVLLDLIMPQYDGFYFLEMVQGDEELQRIPVVITTAYGNIENEIRGLEYGAMDVINVPLEPAIVKQRIKNILKRKSLEEQEAQHRLEEYEKEFVERYHTMLTQTQTMLMEYNCITKEYFYSANVEELLAGEYSDGISFLSAWKEHEVISSKDEEAFSHYVSLAWEGKKNFAPFDVLLKIKQGEFQWHRINLTVILGENKEHHRLIFTINNIHEETAAVEASKRESEMVNMIIDSIDAGLVISNVDETSTYHFVHENLCRLLGYTMEEFMKVSQGSAYGLAMAVDKHIILQRVKNLAHSQYEDAIEYRIMKKNGEILWVQDKGRSFVDEDGITRINSIITDVTILRRTIDNLHYRGKFDHLTNIYNEQAFYLETRKLFTEHPEKEYAIFILDVERFKVINDLFGIEEGDAFLQHIAMNLLKHLKNRNSTYARLVSDSFVFCMPYNSKEEIEEIILLLRKEIRSYPMEFDIGLAFGVYLVVDKGLPINLMCDRCKLALKTVKHKFHEHYAIYNEAMRLDIIKEQEISNDKQRGLSNHEFKVYLQPKYDVDTKQINGAEALVRWIHPEKGMIPPGDFIPLFEKNGFILHLDRYIWEEVCKLLRTWLDEGREVHPISVNVSRVHLYNPSFAQDLIELVEKYNLSPSLLELEITETAYTENFQHLSKSMKYLQERGFSILMDDFGSGYSSLNILKDLPVNVLKIDLNFLSGDDAYGRSGSILISVVRMAKWMNIPVIAEGVETEDQFYFLKSIGCNGAQGYYLARPESVEMYTKRLDGEASLMLPSAKSQRDVIGDFERYWNPNAPSSAFLETAINNNVGLFELNDGILSTVRVVGDMFDVFCTNKSALFEKSVNIFDFVLKEDRSVLLRAMNTSIGKGDIIECEFHLCNRHGNVILLKTKIRFLVGDKQHAVFYIAFSEIQENTGKIQELQERNIILERIFYHIDVIDYGKNQYRSLYSKKEEELSATNEPFVRIMDEYVNLVYPGDQEEFAQLFDAAYLKVKFHARRMPLVRELRILEKDNSYRWISFTVIPLAPYGEKDAYIYCTSNVQDRRKREIEAIFGSIFENMPVGISIFELDKKVRCKYTNHFLDKLLGYTFEEYANAFQEDAEPSLHFALSENVYDKIESHVNKGIPFVKEYKLRGKDGKDHWLLTMANITRDEDQLLQCYTIFKDISKEKEQEELLHTQDERYRILAENSNDVLFDYNYEKNEMEYILHFKNGERKRIVIPDYLDFLKGSNIVHKDFLASFYDTIVNAGKEASQGHYDFRAKFFDDKYVWYRGYYASVADATGKVHHLVGTARDIDQEKNTEKKLVRERMYRNAIFAESLFAFEYDLQEDSITVLHLNKEKEGEYYPYKEYLFSSDNLLIHPDQREIMAKAFDRKALMKKIDAEIGEEKYDICILNKKNEWVWVEVGIHLVSERKGMTYGAICYITDIDINKKEALAILSKAEVDAVTKIFNRGTLEERIHRVLKENPHQNHVFMLLDLDDFKSINDNYGHVNGDRLLKQLGDVLGKNFRHGDIIGRMGGDEFVVFLQNVTDFAAIEEKAKELVKDISALQVYNRWDLPVSCSIGISSSPKDGITMEELFEKADYALYQGKGRGKNCYVLYKEDETLR